MESNQFAQDDAENAAGILDELGYPYATKVFLYKQSTSQPKFLKTVGVNVVDLKYDGDRMLKLSKLLQYKDGFFIYPRSEEFKKLLTCRANMNASFTSWTSYIMSFRHALMAVEASLLERDVDEIAYRLSLHLDIQELWYSFVMTDKVQFGGCNICKRLEMKGTPLLVNNDANMPSMRFSKSRDLTVDFASDNYRVKGDYVFTLATGGTSDFNRVLEGTDFANDFNTNFCIWTTEHMDTFDTRKLYIDAPLLNLPQGGVFVHGHMRYGHAHAHFMSNERVGSVKVHSLKAIGVLRNTLKIFASDKNRVSLASPMRMFFPFDLFYYSCDYIGRYALVANYFITCFLHFPGVDLHLYDDLEYRVNHLTPGLLIRAIGQMHKEKDELVMFLADILSRGYIPVSDTTYETFKDEDLHDGQKVCKLSERMALVSRWVPQTIKRAISTHGKEIRYDPLTS